MGIRIWHQSMAPLSEFGQYASVLESHIGEVVSPGVDVVLHGAAPGSYLGRPPAAVLRYPYAKHVIQQQAIDACRQAEDEGFDAVAIASFGDPFVTECRSLVDIPVAAMAESALLVGCSLARRLALVPLTPRSVPRLAELVRGLGLESRVSFHPLDPPSSEAALVEILGSGDADELVRSFTAVATEAVAAGADLVVPAEGALNEVLHVAGVRAVGEAPVMDVVAVVFAYAEMLVHLRRRTGLTVGRAWSYPTPDPELLAGLRAFGRHG